MDLIDLFIKQKYEQIDEVIWEASKEEIQEFYDYLQRRLRDEPALGYGSMVHLYFNNCTMFL